jgi:hypothetical protein
MKLTVSTTAKVQSARSATPLEYALLVQPVLNKQVETEVPGNTLISGLCTLLIVQFGFTTLPAAFDVEKDGVPFDTTLTLDQCGIVDGDVLTFRVVLNLQ